MVVHLVKSAPPPPGVGEYVYDVVINYVAHSSVVP